MSVNPDDFESQFMAPLHLVDETQFLYSNQNDENDGVERPANDDTMEEFESPRQESIQCRVQETQFIPLEVETQTGTQQAFQPSHRVDSQASSQESFQSLVRETQLVTLESDTQIDTQLANPATNQTTNEANDQAFINFVNHYSAPKQPANVVDAARSELPVVEESISTRLFERPIAPSAQDLGAGFKFSAPANCPILRARPKTSEQVSRINLPSTTASKIERERMSAPAENSSNRHQATSNDVPSNRQPIPRQTVSQHAQASSTSPTNISGHRAAMANGPTTLTDSSSTSLRSMTQEVVDPPFQASSRTTSSAFGATENSPSAPPRVTASSHHSVQQEAMQQRARHSGHSSENISSHEAATQNISSAFPQAVPEAPQAVRSPPPKFTEKIPTKSNLNKVQVGPQDTVFPPLPQRDDVLHVPPSPLSDDAQPNPRLKSVQSISHENTPQRIPLRDPLAPLRGAQSSRPVQRSSSKGRRLPFCPFPEAVTSQSNRHWPCEKVPDVSQETNISAEEYMNLEDTITRPETASNVGRARTIGNGLDQANKIEVDRPDSPSISRIVRGNVDLPQAEGQSKNIIVENEYAAEEAEQLNNPKLRICMSHGQAKDKSSDKNLQEAPHSRSETLHHSGWSYAHASPPTHERHNFSDYPEHPDAEENNENVIFGSQNILQVLPRVPSRAHSLTRPESRRSNEGKAMTRPLLSILQTQGTFEVNRNHDVASKVVKSNNRQNISAGAAQSRPLASKSSFTFAKYIEFLQKGAEFAEVVRSCEEQQALIESQKADIMKLVQASESSQKQIQALEAEKATLSQDMQKFADMSSKYKKHMNEVVKTQKFLKAEALELRRTSSEALMAQGKKEAIMLQIRAAVNEARDIGLSVNNLSEKLLAASNKMKELEGEKKELENDKTDLLKQLDAAKKTNEMLKDDLEHGLLELSHETHRKEKLEKQLETQTSTYKELVEQMNQLPGVVAEQLQSETGFLANILNEENAIHAKIDGVASLVNAVKSNEPEPPASLIILIEDLFSRLENRDQNAETGLSSVQEANSRALEELKETLGQLRLDKDTETRYNDRIADLAQAKATVTADKSALESEIQSMTQQVENLKRDITDCHSQLAIRDEELAVARAIPAEDPRLKTQIQELERSKAVLEGQLAGANKELSEANNNAKFIQETIRLKERKTTDLEQRLHNAQIKIRTFNEERDNYIAAKELENKAACQDLTRKAETQKVTMKLKLESEVRNIEQRYKEKETELGLIKEKLQKLHAERDTSASDSSKLRYEQFQYLEKTKQHVAQIKQLEEGAPSRKISEELLKGLQSVRNESAEIQNLFCTALGKPQQIIDAAIQKQQQIESNLRNVADLEAEKNTLREQNIALQDIVESLNKALARRTQTKVGAGKQSLTANTTTVQVSTSENIPQMKLDRRASRSSSRSHKVRSELETHGALDTGGMDSPVETLRKAMKRAEPKSTIQIGRTQNVMVRNISISTPQIHGGRSTSMVGSGSVASSSSWQQGSASQSSAQGITPFSEVAPSVQSSSSLSELDTDKLLDEIDLEGGGASTTNDGNYERSDVTMPSSAFGSIPKQIAPSETSRAFGDQPLDKKVKSTRNLNAPQLTSKPLKSAMKQSTKQAFGVDCTPNHITFAESANSSIPGELKMDSMSNIPRQEFRPEHLPGARSGKGVGSNVVTSARWSQTNDQQPSLVPGDQGSPVAAHGLRRYNLKRANPGSESSKSPRKRHTASRKPSRSVIPDSQETM